MKDWYNPNMKLERFYQAFVFLLLFLLVFTLSTPVAITPTARAQRYTLPLEFDYLSWEFDAFLTKLEQTGIDPWQSLSPEQQHQLVLVYFDLVRQLEQTQATLQQIYADPNITNTGQTASPLLTRQEQLQSSLKTLTPLAESILQGQVGTILAEQNIARLGSALPPILFHTTPLPKALILSPRDKIEQDVNISLLADLTLEQITQLEERIEIATGESALVVDVGGIGVYPTMVMRSSNLPWIMDTIAHEWTHNYLTLRPLGINYDLTPELRTMNETTAAIVAEEISRIVLQEYYPEFVDTRSPGLLLASLNLPDGTFDFRQEMHTTRVRVDELLAQGKITEAEDYMEARRVIFVNHGYAIRKLNQAYFAFHGAYADQPGGAAGQDPVGPAVRQLRAESDSLAEFLRTIAQMNSFSELQQTLSSQPN